MPRAKKKASQAKKNSPLKNVWRKIWVRRPLSYKVGLVLIALLAFGGLLVAAVLTKQAPAPEPVVEPQPLQVKALRFGDTQLAESSVGQVKNLNTMTLVAQSAGPVSKVAVAEGTRLTAGQLVLSQETAYRAGNAMAVNTQISAKNYDLADKSLANTVEVVAKTREQADKSREDIEELRKISAASIDDTKAIIELSETQADALEELIEAASDDSTKATLRGSLLSTLGSLSSARSTLRSLEYQTNTDQPPTKLAELQKDLIYKTTELQLQSAQIQKDIAWLSLKAARIQEATTRVVAPLAGTIEKLYVQPGTYVTPGQPVAVLRGEPRLCLVTTVAGKVAGRVDETQSIEVTVDRELTLNLPITHVSSAPVAGNLFEVLAVVPPELASRIFENQTLPVKLPLYQLSVIGGNSFIPLDAVFVTNTSRFVFVYQDGKAVRRDVETGEIIGDTIEILSGLTDGEIVILDRRVIDQQPVEVQIESAAGELG